MIKQQSFNLLDKIFQNLKTHQIDIKNWEIDHLCYRTSSLENYDDTKKVFQKLGKLLIESEVNGRMIATYKLQNPIFYNKWIIDLIEVPAPKPGKITEEGFEHIEVVIDESFKEFQDRHSQITFSKKGLDKDLNPELEIKFPSCAIKFHHKSLEHIINIERNSDVLEFLRTSQILAKLKAYDPCLSGTLPLNIQNSSSDLDILFFSEDLDTFLSDVTGLYQGMNQFSFHKSEQQGLESLVVNFDYNGLPIELFCQNKNVFQQQANQHFLVEGRLLKLLGEGFSERIRNLKANGIKTEPAFGEELNLSEPYQELVQLNQLSDLELYKKFSDTKFF